MRLLTTLIFITLFSISYSQTIVGTSPSSKKVLLEHFAGIHNGFDPDADDIGTQIINTNPGQVYHLKIHQGPFSDPALGGQDFRTSFGDAIASPANIAGYPSGTVNRKDFGNGQNPNSTGMSRSDWSGSVDTELQLASPVNVGVVATVDYSTRLLTVQAECYYTSTDTSSHNNIHIALASSENPGYQENYGNYNPNDYYSIDDKIYNHSNVLRHLLTGQGGAQISATTQGSLYANTWTYTLPTQINNIELFLGELEVIAFVTNSSDEIVNCEWTEVTILNSPTAHDAGIVSDYGVFALPSGCLTTGVSSKFLLRNEGGTTLTNLNYTVEINNINQTFSWSGNLQPSEIELIDVPAIQPGNSGLNQYIVTLANDLDLTNNQDTNALSIQPTATNTIYLDLLTDGWPGETSWQLLDENNNIIDSVQYVGSNGSNAPGGQDAYTQFNYSWSLTPDQCYTFQISDAFGDGINGGQFSGGGANGNYQLYYFDPNGNQIFLKQNDGTVGFDVESTSFSTISGSGIIQAPTNLLAKQITDTSALLTWDTVPNATAYRIVYKQLGEQGWPNQLIKNGQKFRHREKNFAPGTTYIWGIFSKDSSGWSLISMTDTFTTNFMPCNLPTSRQTINISSDQARAKWNSVPNSTGYTVRFREVGTSIWSKFNKPPSNPKGWMTGLSSNTTYEWQVRTKCGPGIASPWSPSLTFTTLTFKKGVSVERFEQGTATIFPNPFSDGQFFIQNLSGENKIEIFSLTGQLLHEQHVTENETTIRVQTPFLAKGVYIIKIIGPHSFESQRIIVQ